MIEEVLPIHRGLVIHTIIDITIDCSGNVPYLTVRGLSAGVLYLGHAHKEMVGSVCDVVAKNIAIQLRERIESLYA